jgi:hypothetical protein
MRRNVQLAELDGLRLIGLGRIPRCKDCPRFADLIESYVNPRQNEGRLASAPRGCAHQCCAPIARRYGAPARELDFVETRVAS